MKPRQNPKQTSKSKFTVSPLFQYGLRGVTKSRLRKAFRAWPPDGGQSSRPCPAGQSRYRRGPFPRTTRTQVHPEKDKKTLDILALFLKNAKYLGFVANTTA